MKKIAITAFLLLAAGVPGAHATVPGATGRLVFAVVDTHSVPQQWAKIVSSVPDGTDQQTLTEDHFDGYPAWSPDGKRIAFSRAAEDPHGDGIWIMNADGTDQHAVITDESSNYQPAWSPDGRRLAFVSDRDGSEQIYSAAIDGSGVRRLTNAKSRVGSPAFSPSGETIAFNDFTPRQPGIYKMRADGTDIRLVVANGFDPTWSPDGRAIGFDRMYHCKDGSGDTQWCSDILSVRPDGSGAHRLGGPTKDSRGRSIETLYSYPAWSPGGCRFAFVAAPVGGPGDVYWIATTDDHGRGYHRIATLDSATDPDWQPLPSRGAPACVQPAAVARAQPTQREIVSPSPSTSTAPSPAPRAPTSPAPSLPPANPTGSRTSGLVTTSIGALALLAIGVQNLRRRRYSARS